MPRSPLYHLVTENPDRWKALLPDIPLVSARQYLSSPDFAAARGCRVLNLCASYRYQSLGYYVSLLADARQHRPMPAVDTVQDTKTPSIIRMLSDELEEIMPKVLANLNAPGFVLCIYFSKTVDKAYERLGRQIFNLFPAPLLKATFSKGPDGWALVNIDLLSLSQVPQEDVPFVKDGLLAFISRGGVEAAKRKPPRFYLGILWDPKEPGMKASNARAIQKFIDAGEELGIECDILERDDYGELGEYDGLFIRETTAVNHYTYRFARRAHWENMIVIDDPQSILKCANKVFQAQLMGRLKIPTPHTVLVDRDNQKTAWQLVGLPAVLKQPDSSFSLGVKRVSSEAEWLKETSAMLEKSEIIVAQSFVQSEFDWRVTVLNQQPLFVCKYFQVSKHWQIYRHSENGAKSPASGRSVSVPLDEVPPAVLKTALRAANAIGNGLYGVDLKQCGKDVLIIEVNDNPNIDAGVEDLPPYNDVYQRVMQHFLARMEARAFPGKANTSSNVSAASPTEETAVLR